MKQSAEKKKEKGKKPWSLRPSKQRKAASRKHQEGEVAFANPLEEKGEDPAADRSPVFDDDQ